MTSSIRACAGPDTLCEHLGANHLNPVPAASAQHINPSGGCSDLKSFRRKSRSQVFADTSARAEDQYPRHDFRVCLRRVLLLIPSERLQAEATLTMRSQNTLNNSDPRFSLAKELPKAAT